MRCAWVGVGFALSIVAACVGDDPDATSAPNDAGSSDSPSNADVQVPSDADADAAVDAGRCDPSKPFGALEAIPELASSGGKSETSPSLSDDERRIFFLSDRDGTNAVYFAERGSNGTFNAPALVTLAIDGGTTATNQRHVERVAMTKDELRLYVSYSPNGLQDYQVWLAQRTTPTGAFGAATLVSMPAATSNASPAPNAEGTRLYYAVEEQTNLFHLRSVDCTAPDQCGSSRSFPLLDTNVLFGDGNPVVSRDEKTLFFSSFRDVDAATSRAIYATKRSDPSAAFVSAEIALSVRPNNLLPGWLSPDGCNLYVSSDKDGSYDLFVSRRGK